MKLPALLLLLLLLALTPTLSSAQDLEIHIISLDTHGESILVRTPQGRALLIDGGLPQAGPQVAAYLRQVGVTALDLVVSTHDDPDHFGGLPLVLEALPARAFWESPVRAGGLRRAFRPQLEQALAQRRVHREEVSRGARLEVEPGVLLEVLAPTTPFFSTPRHDDPNGDSLVLRLTHGRTRFLLMGDATRATEARLLEGGTDLACDVLKVPHHGFDTSSSSAFLEATGARTAVIGCAPGSGPAGAVLDRLEAAGIAWYRTDTNGTVVIRSSGEPDALDIQAARGHVDDADSSPSPGVRALAARYVRFPLFTPPAGEFAGRVGARAFHRQGCVVRALISRSRVVTFRTAAEAADAGRAPCLLCRP